MSDLTDKKCEACTIDAPLVNPVKYPDLLKELENWSIKEESTNKLVKAFNFANYADSVSFANKVVDLAEVEDHHPKIRDGDTRIALHRDGSHRGDPGDNDHRHD